MAQGSIATATPINGAPIKDANWELLEYEKILRFRDQVLNGTHPRVKVPPNLVGKLNASPRTVSSPSNPNQQRSTTNQAASSLSTSSPGHDAIQSQKKTNSTDTQHPPLSRSAPTVPNVSKSATELDPIFLAKSEELVKAEIQLQRQRIERNLRDQIEQRKIAVKLALQTSESLPDFDLSEVLAKALQTIQSVAGADVEFPAPDSDSFDENTFYSSQHDTPDNRSFASQDHAAPGEVEMLDTLMVDQTSPIAHNRSAYPRSPDIVMSGVAAQKQPESTSVTGQNQGQSHSYSSRDKPRYNLRGKQPAKSIAGQKFDEPVILEEASTSAKDSSNTSPNNSNDPSHDSTDSNAARLPNRRSLNNTAHGTFTDPIIRATHDLSPVAPQAARVSTLLTPKVPAANEPARQNHVAAPNNVSIVSSPEGAKGSRAKKRNEKKKKDKGRKKQAASPVPYIKPEPRSPSPFEPLSRPLKRQRQSFQTADGLDYDEPRRDRQEERPAVAYDAGPAPRPTTQARGGELRAGYETDPRSYSPKPIRRERDDIDYRRIASVQHARRPLSPAQYSLPYSPTEIRRVRAASQTAFERPTQEPVRYYREEQIPRREIIDLDRERSRSPVYRERRTPLPMAPPPRALPERVVVDAHGRRYYAPAPLAEEKYYSAPSTSVRYSVAPSARPREVVRYSVAPPARDSDHEVVYERAPMRPPPEVISDDYEDRRIVYRRPASPQFAVPPVRRVAPQSEREGTVDLRAYREREYSTRPATIAPQDEYVRVRGPVERRQMSHYPEAPGEYVSRASMHPEPIRYEIPREYVGRLQSVHPEALGREFAPSVRPEPRREMIREASVRPGEAGLTRREYAAPPPMDGERYEFARPVRRVIEEPIYIDGPRETGPDTNPRRDVYR